MIRRCLPSLMNNVTFNILLLFLQIYCTSELGGGKITGGKGSHVGHLIRKKSGKVFLRRSSKKALSSKKNAADDEEDANDGKASDKSSNNGGHARMSLGVVLPKHAPSGINIFELCQAGKCVEAGQLGSFGGSAIGADYQGSPPIDKKNYILRDTDVTDLVKKQGWSLKKPFKTKMTKSVVPNLPPPVVIIHQLGKEGEDTEKKILILSQKEKEKYGNLIEGYSIKSKI